MKLLKVYFTEIAYADHYEVLVEHVDPAVHYGPFTLIAHCSPFKYALPEQAPPHRYRFRIRAVNAQGKGPWSSWTDWVPNWPPQDAPRILQTECV